jgi:hypothetical protein
VSTGTAENERQQALATLLAELRAGPSGALELLAAALVERLTGVGMAVARSGFQSGGDAGTTGRAGRHLRVECKRYLDTTPLSDRELQGQLDDARRGNSSLEVWVLVATRVVGEGTRQKLHEKSLEVGVPVVVVDWTVPQDGLPDLAALCAWASDLVGRHYTSKADEAAKQLYAGATERVDRLRRELQPWAIGSESVRDLARRRLDAVWSAESESRAHFGQNAAGGANPETFIERKGVSSQLDLWWSNHKERPVVVHGAEGHGKTWAALGWLTNRLEALPISIAVPASALMEIRSMRESSILDFLARELRDRAGVLEEGYWRRRLERLLTRPAEEGDCLLLVVDGLNQEPSVDWRQFVNVLQGSKLRSRLSVLLTTQTMHFDGALERFRYVSGGVDVAVVEPYDPSPNGEFDQILKAHGRTQKEFPSDLRRYARVPRLLPLVLALSRDTDIQGEPTVTRLLFAYGRDQLAMRERRAFSMEDWEAWLQKLAAVHLAEIADRGALAPLSFTRVQLDSHVALASLEHGKNLRRLEEIVDGTWMEPVAHHSNVYRPKESTINLALGVDVVSLLEGVVPSDLEEVEARLARWLDPLRATSSAADILAAALSIAVHKGLPTESPVTQAILTALLQSQNVGEAHRMEVQALAPALGDALLEATERSLGRPNTSARAWAVESLRRIPVSNAEAWERIFGRLSQWVSHVTCPATSEESHKFYADRLVKRIGSADLGTRPVLGVPIRVHERENTDLAQYVPQLLLDRPLLPAARVLIAASVATAIDSERHSVWTGLRWVLLLNRLDRVATVIALSAKATSMQTGVVAENGVSSELSKRVAALLFWLTTDESCERLAYEIPNAFGRGGGYESYLKDPIKSGYAVERRHAAEVLSAADMWWLLKAQKLELYLGDPTLTADSDFSGEVAKAAADFDTVELRSKGFWDQSDHKLGNLLPLAARFAPTDAADIGHRFLLGLRARTGEARKWAADAARAFFLLSDASTSAAASFLAMSRSDGPADAQERMIALHLMEIGIAGEPVDRQLDQLVEVADAFLTIELLEIVRPGSPEVAKRFVRRHDWSNQRVREVLLNYMAMHPVDGVDDEVFGLVENVAFEEPPSSLRVLAFMALARSESIRFGKILIDRGWQASPSREYLEQVHGSASVLAASASKPLRELATIVAPWALLSEVARRGGIAEEVREVASLLSEMLRADVVSAPPDSIVVSVDTHRPLYAMFEPAVPEVDIGEEDLASAFNPNERLRLHNMALETGKEYLERLRKEGLGLGLQVFDVAEARMLIKHAMPAVSQWLDGMEGPSVPFLNRLNGAGGLYLALCEALMENDSPLAIPLWHAIERNLRITYVGVAEINALRFLPFRVQSDVALELREYLYKLQHHPTDRTYLELVICATASKASDWLRDRARLDQGATETWRQMRGVAVEGLLGHDADVHALAWPQGPTITTLDEVRKRATERSHCLALAKHWWHEYGAAADATSAYRAWILFCAYVDRRAFAWLTTLPQPEPVSDEVHRLKVLNFRVNRYAFKKALASNETSGRTNLSKNLFELESPERWFEMSALDVA